MAIKFNFITEKDMLFVETSGFDENLKEVMTYNQAVYEEAVKNDLHKVLCDEQQLEYRLSTTYTYELAKSMADVLPYFAKIAIVTVHKNKESADFWETVAVNRGINVKVFYDKPEAIDWLSAQ